MVWAPLLKNENTERNGEQDKEWNGTERRRWMRNCFPFFPGDCMEVLKCRTAFKNIEILDCLTIIWSFQAFCLKKVKLHNYIEISNPLTVSYVKSRFAFWTFQTHCSKTVSYVKSPFVFKEKWWNYEVLKWSWKSKYSLLCSMFSTNDQAIGK